MSSAYDDSPLRSLVDGLADEHGRILLEDFSHLICEQMGVSEEQAAGVTQQLDPNGEGYIDVEVIYETFRALIPQQGSRGSTDSQALGNEETDYGASDDDEPPELPDSPEPVMDDLTPSPQTPSTIDNIISRSRLPRARAQDEEEFVGEGEEDDVMSGTVSPSSSRMMSPRKSSSFIANHSTASLQLNAGGGWMHPSLSQSSIQSAELHDALHEEQMQQATQKVTDLSEQLASIMEERDSSDTLQRKMKQDYAAMQSRLHHLEEQIREREESHQQALRNAQEKQKLKIAHLENKFNSQHTGINAQLAASQDETRQLKAMEAALRDQCKEAKKDWAARSDELESLKKTLARKEAEQSNLVAQQRRETEGASATIEHLQAQLAEVAQRGDQYQRECEELKKKNQKTKSAADQSTMATQHLEAEVARLQKEVARLNTRNNDLSAQLIKQGKMLMESPDEGKNSESLEAEMNEQSKDEIMKSLRDERNYHQRLKEYIDNLLVVVMDQSPHLLEVRSK